jgi:hypothetical protein
MSIDTCERELHVVHFLVRDLQLGKVCFLLLQHDKWQAANGVAFWALPAKKTLAAPNAREVDGVSIEFFVDQIAQNELGLTDNDYALDQELEPRCVELSSPRAGIKTRYWVYAVDVWVKPEARDAVRQRFQGQWVPCEDAVDDESVSPTARVVFQMILDREFRLDAMYRDNPAAENQEEAPRRLLASIPDKPTMSCLARKWLAKNNSPVRVLRNVELETILEAGTRAFNPRVADPYLSYQDQGFGFTWSFFTHKDRQDLHIHPVPIVEIYGVLRGELEIWWRPHHGRGSSAWSHRVLQAGDWVEVGPLQWHIVRWLGKGMGVVFKAGPGPLAGVGRLGVAGKTVWSDQAAVKPPAVLEMEKQPAGV